MMLRGSPVVETIFDATADTPNAIEPTRFSAAMRHEMLRSRHDHQPWLTSNQARPLATRKQIDPTMSGTHTRRWAWVASRLASMRGEGRDVEEHGAHELHRARRPVDAAGLPRPEAEAPIAGLASVPVGACGARSSGLQVLEVRGRGEEDRADEEGDGVGVGPDPADVARQRTDGEAQRRRSRTACRSTSRPRSAPTTWSRGRRRGGRPACGARRDVHSTTLAVGRAVEALRRDERAEPRRARPRDPARRQARRRSPTRASSRTTSRHRRAVITPRVGRCSPDVGASHV